MCRQIAQLGENALIQSDMFCRNGVLLEGESSVLALRFGRIGYFCRRFHLPGVIPTAREKIRVKWL